MIKNRYKDDYSWTARLNGKGRVVDDICYTGEYYILPFTKEEKTGTNWVNIGFALCLMLLQIAAGMVNQASSRTFWIVYPYLFTFLPVAYFAIGAFSYFSHPVRMQQVQYETGLARMRRSCTGSIVMNGISVVLDVIYMVTNHDNADMTRELIYLGILLAYIAVAFAYGYYYNKTYGGLRTQQSSNKAE